MLRARDRAGNIIAYGVMIALNTAAVILPLNGQTVADVSDRYPTLFTPAGFTFSIWSVIYLLLLVFVIWQALPGQRGHSKTAAISPWFQSNCVLNAAWIVAWQYNQLVLAMLIMLSLLATLVVIYRKLLLDDASASLVECLIVHLPFSVYTAWISVATIANLSVLQVAYGWEAAGIDPVSWTWFKLAFAGAVGATVVLTRRDVPFVLVIAWAAFGISAKQAATPEITGAAATLGLLMLLLAVRASWLRLMHSA